PEKPCRAAVGAQQPQQHPHGRRFAGPVRAEKAVNLALGYLKVEPVERAGAPERLDQASNLNRRRITHRSLHLSVSIRERRQRRCRKKRHATTCRRAKRRTRRPPRLRTAPESRARGEGANKVRGLLK